MLSVNNVQPGTEGSTDDRATNAAKHSAGRMVRAESGPTIVRPVSLRTAHPVCGSPREAEPSVANVRAPAAGCRARGTKGGMRRVPGVEGGNKVVRSWLRSSSYQTERRPTIHVANVSGVNGMQ